MARAPAAWPWPRLSPSAAFRSIVSRRWRDVGGIWNPESPHVVYGSTYLNSSKKLSRYPDFHFPEEWAPYASRAQAQDYLRAYAKEFGLYPLISFNKRVTRAEHTPQGWRVQIEGESAPRSYAGLVVANGHHWEAVDARPIPAISTARCCTRTT